MLKRDHMLKAFGAALLMVSALAMTADPARALQVVVTQVNKNTDGSMTYHFAVKTDPGETLTPGASKARRRRRPQKAPRPAMRCEL